jgi:hypothetical protein
LIPGLTGVVAIAGNLNNSYFLKNDGTVWAAGYNVAGGLGQGHTAFICGPVQVKGLTSVVAIATGWLHAYALLSDGTVWAWGQNPSGVLGDGTMIDRPTPVRVLGLDNVTDLGSGSVAMHSAAVKADGTVWTWGQNYSGQLCQGNASPFNLTPTMLTGVNLGSRAKP